MIRELRLELLLPLLQWNVCRAFRFSILKRGNITSKYVSTLITSHHKITNEQFVFEHMKI